MDMNLEALGKYPETLEQTFSLIVKTFNKLQLEDYSIKTIDSSNRLIVSGKHIVSTLRSHLKCLENLLAECGDFVEEITEDLSQPEKSKEYVYSSSGGMLAIPGRDVIVKVIQDKLKQSAQPKECPKDSKETQKECIKPKQKISIIHIPDIKYSMKFPVVSDLKQIPPAIFYLMDTDKSKCGLYMNLLNGNYARIPFPEVIDSKKEYDRKQSIRCKYMTKDECDSQRQKMAKLHNSIVRSCNFAHLGESIVKIGYSSRCPGSPSYGNPKTMQHDISLVAESDFKNLLMYGLNDIISSIVWLDYKQISGELYEKLDLA